MGRVGCPGEGFPSAWLRAVAAAVDERGGGFADVTTRGDLLLQVPDAELAALQAALMQEAPTQGASDDSQAVSAPSDGIGHWVPHKEDLTGVHEQQPGFFWIGVPLAAGRVSAAQLRKAADLAERHGDGKVGLTLRQGLLFLNVPQEKVLNILEGLQLVDLKPQGSAVRCGLAVCSETDACVEGWPELSGRARELIEYLERQVLLTEPLRTRVAGRSCACGDTGAEEILLVAVALEQQQGVPGDHYDLRVKGRLLAGAVRGEEVKFLLERLLVSWKRQRRPEESLGAFCDRVGHEQVAQQLAETA